jgi:hypothetical protein
MVPDPGQVIHLSTNKVYGDRPNTIALTGLDTRWDYADPLLEAAYALMVDRGEAAALALATKTKDQGPMSVHGRPEGAQSRQRAGMALYGNFGPVGPVEKSRTHPVRCRVFCTVGQGGVVH